MTKITIEDYRKMTEKEFEQTIDAKWNNMALHIKHTLNLKEMMSFVQYVTGSCFSEDTNEYLPEIRDFATRCCIIENYSDLVLPESTDEKYEIVYNSDIVAFIVQKIDQPQFKEMLAAIDVKIKHMAQNSIEALNKQMSEVFSGLSILEKVASDMFNGIDTDTISKIAKTISDGGFSEKKLIEAFKSGVDE